MFLAPSISIWWHKMRERIDVVQTGRNVRKATGYIFLLCLVGAAVSFLIGIAAFDGQETAKNEEALNSLKFWTFMGFCFGISMLVIAWKVFVAWIKMWGASAVIATRED